MSALHKKLRRDLWHLRGQVLAISLVIASGVATFVMSISTLESLQLTRSAYYRENRFAEMFVSLKRAPEYMRDRMRLISGVQQVETRVVAPVNLVVDDYPDPVSGLMISIPDSGEPLLNRLYLRRGRLVDPQRDNEVVLNEPFAEAHGFTPGDQLRATINGRQRRLTIVGIALSPEYIFQFKPGEMIPDFKGYGVMWMARSPLAAAYDMEGAFNSAALTLTRDANPKDVIDRLDDLLDPYGGLGAYERKDQISHRYLNEEFRQLRQMATMFPTIFLGVAVFLLNVVVSRLVSTEREQIALLKAFGYSNVDVALHYTKLILAIVVLGAVLGVVAGAWFGQGLSNMYMRFYRFPYLHYQLRPNVPLRAILISGGAALAGTFVAIRRAALLPPAEAMRPEPPAKFRETLVERLGLKTLLSQPTRMIIRSLERRPVKALLSVSGIAASCAILTVSFFFRDTMDDMIHVQFSMIQRDDMTVTLTEPTSYQALYELQSLEGVEFGEAFRTVSARLRFEHRTYLTSIQGLEPGGDLRKILDDKLKAISLPDEGLVLTQYLGEFLGVKPGDYLTVEVLEGSRPIRQVRVAAFVNEFLGVSAYMTRDALNRFMHEGPAISGAYLATDANHLETIYRKLEDAPRVAGTAVHEKVVRNLNETMSEQMLTFAFIATLFAATIAFGVVYNSARISLSERGRELASLRVLGMTRGEISFILLGELGILTLAAIPVGFFIGRLLCAYMIYHLQTDLFRFSLVIYPSTYAFSATVVLVSACVSGALVRRRLDHLDLVAVLKTRE